MKTKVVAKKKTAAKRKTAAKKTAAKKTAAKKTAAKKTAAKKTAAKKTAAKKTAAKKKTAAAKLDGALRGARVMIATRLAREDHTHWLARIKALGGRVVQALDERVSILIVHDDGPQAPEAKQAAKLNADGVTVEILRATAFAKRFAPTAEELVAILHAGNKGVKQLSALHTHSWRVPGFPWPPLRSADLRGLSLEGVVLSNFKLRGADLREANLKGSYLDQLHDCDLRGATLDRSTINVIKGCDLRGASFRRAYLSEIADSDLRDAKLGEARLSDIEVTRCNLEGADLSEADLHSTKMPGTNMCGATLVKADLNGADLSGVDLSGADLSDAQLAKAQLAKAKLVNAKLVRANLGGADLSGAKLEGADFTGVNLAGAKIASRGKSKIKGLAEALQDMGGEIGPRLRELSTIAKSAARIKTKAAFDLSNGKTASVEIDANNGSWRQIYVRTEQGNHGESTSAKSLAEAMQDSANRWGRGTLALDSITVSSSKSPVAGRELKRLVIAAWCEACGMEAPQEPAPKKGKKPSKAERQRTLVGALLDDLRSGPAGVERWNARSHDAWGTLGKDASFTRSELTGAALDGVRISGLDFSLSTFDGASMKNADISDSVFDKASFVGADLSGASISKTKMIGADLSGATLDGSTLTECDLSGDSKLAKASFVGATLPKVKIVSDSIAGVRFENVDLSGTDLAGMRIRAGKFTGTFDGHTRFPPDYKPPKGLVGPRDAKGMPKAAAGVTLSLEDFLSRLKVTVGTSSYNKGKSMLKKSRYQLFSEVTDERMVAVVKSQSDPSRLYSCILGEKSYSCITHRLNKCGGLYRGPCKHMMVMIMGLANAGTVDPGSVDAWVQKSMKAGSTFDKDAAAEVFLRYKGAEAGEIDWRPTETVPEDFYAF